MANTGETFQNGETCTGTVMHIDPNGAYELDVIEINGQYPNPAAGEAWARNEASEVTVKALKGIGSIAIREMIDEKPAYHFVSLGAEGDQPSVRIPSGTWYAWESQGDEAFVAMASFAPPFDPGQYRTASERQIVEGGQG